MASPVSKLSHVASSRDVASLTDNEDEIRFRFVSFTRARDAAGVEQTVVDRADDGGTSVVLISFVPATDTSAADIVSNSSGTSCGNDRISSMIDRRVGDRRTPRSLPMV